MNWRRICITLLAVMLIGIGSTGAVVFAEEGNAVTNSLLPVIPMGRGDACVEDTDFMRRNHMELLKHQRDETVLEGARSEQYSLMECLDCHAVAGQDANPVTFTDSSHFCRSCHDYAAVSIDCFQCHASRPESGILPADHQFSGVFPGTAKVNGSE
jgi:predicted CXXCH cytochrome family protein